MGADVREDGAQYGELREEREADREGQTNPMIRARKVE